MGRVRTAIYDRLEEISFRSGVTLAACVLATAVGVATAVAVTLDGHDATVTSASGAATAAPQAPSAMSTAVSPTAAPPRSRPPGPAASLAPVAAYQRPAPAPVATVPAQPVPAARDGLFPHWRGSWRGGRPDWDRRWPPGGWPERPPHGPRWAAWRAPPRW